MATIAQEVKHAPDDNSVTDFAGWTEDLEGVTTISYEMFVMVALVKAVQELSIKTLLSKHVLQHLKLVLIFNYGNSYCRTNCTALL